jgi:hypothetical protein
MRGSERQRKTGPVGCKHQIVNTLPKVPSFWYKQLKLDFSVNCTPAPHFGMPHTRFACPSHRYDVWLGTRLREADQVPYVTP